MIEKILCTIGPNSLNEKVLSKLDELGCFLFRINLSHTKIEDLEQTIEKIRKYSNVPICLDSEGAQIRTTKFSCDFIKDKEYIFENTINKFSIRPFEIVHQLSIGDQISMHAAWQESVVMSAQWALGHLNAQVRAELA